MPSERSALAFLRRFSLPSRQRRMWLGMVVGGGLGCALLLGILALALSMFGLLTGEDASPIAPTGSGAVGSESTASIVLSSPVATVSTATLVGEDSLERSTLAALNRAADATFTAAALSLQSQPTATAAAIQPVGVRERPALNPALQAATGELVYFAKRVSDAESEPEFEIVTLDLDTWETRRFSARAGSSSYPQASPDGRWIAFQSDRDGDFDIYVVNRHGGQLRQLTRNAVWDRLPAWSPDGAWIIFSSDVRGDETFDLYRVRPEGGEPQPVYSDGWRNSHARFNPAGDRLIFTAGANVRDSRGWELRLLDLASGESQLLTKNEVRDASPVFSVDGGQILYVTSISGARAIARTSLAGGARDILYTGPGNAWAASYSPDGRFIVVTATRNGEDELYLMQADGSNIQQITSDGGAYASWIPPLSSGT